MKKKIRILIVDDSALVRKILSENFSNDPELEVIGTAGDPYQARDILVLEKPDVVTLDVDMPRMDGITFLKRYMQVIPTPTIIVSSLTDHNKRLTMDALEAGAVDIVPKPNSGLIDSLPLMMAELVRKIKMAATVNVSRIKRDPIIHSNVAMHSLNGFKNFIIAIGSSTGGTEALARILPVFPATCPGIVIVQHMPAEYTASLAERLNRLSQMTVNEAKNGDRVIPGHILIAPGGMQHMKVHRYAGQHRIKLVDGDPVSSHRPSVDVLFQSVAETGCKNVVAVLMTGMGKDGAAGLLEIRKAGGRTFVQDEKTSVVWGMPKVAWQLNAAEAMVALDNIPGTIIKAVKQAMEN
jgi:two-component system chemotaxis response regulator CheB